MDWEQPRQEPAHQSPAQTPAEHSEHRPKAKRKGKKAFLTIFILLLLAGAAAAGWYYRDMDAKKDAKATQSEIDGLKAKNAKLESDLKTATANSNSDVKPSEQDLEKIKTAINGGKYSDLETLMAEKVAFILAASEGLGNRTPAQAIADLAYLDAGTDPWDFNLPAATIDDYQAGDYKQYFADDTLVGKSANGYVVAFSFDGKGKIDTIFVTNDDDLL